MTKSIRPSIREAFVRFDNQLRVHFYTSNEQKFQQAHAIFRDYGLDLHHFRTRNDPYVEDYSAGKEALLKLAISEVRRIVGSESIFFVEDTSLRIEALSTSVDFPGLAVKEWFADTTFEQLDHELRSRNIGRTATVSSDIALHLPRLSQPVFFNAAVSGEVAETPPTFNTNVRFPWLTPDSFNGWFVPNGSSLRLGEMSFEESLSYDFRVHALSKLVARLEEYAVVLNLPTQSYSRKIRNRHSGQLQLFGDPKPVLIVVGLPCSGKTTFSKIAEQNHDLKHIEASQVIRTFRDQYEPEALEGLSDFEFAEMVLHDLGADIVARRIVEWYGSDLDNGVVISGFRTIEEMEFVRSVRPDVQVVLVEASERTRFRRCLERGRASGPNTLAEFHTVGTQQAGLGLLQVASDFADARVENEYSLVDYAFQVGQVVVGDGHAEVVGVSRHIRPRHQDKHNQLFRALAALEGESRPLTCEEIEQITTAIGGRVRANNANKVLKKHSGLARRIEAGAPRIRYELTPAGRAYVKYMQSLINQDT